MIRILERGIEMKKTIFITLFVLIIAALVAPPAFAKPGKGNIKGEVVTVGPGDTLTILTVQGETVTVITPEGYSLETFEAGDWVLVRGSIQPDGTLLAERIQEIGRGSEDDDDGTDRMNSAYCSEGKQVKAHPLAVKLSDRYGVTPEWVMGHFCSGQGMGAIMLALKMAEAYDADADVLLAERAAGKGWGQIWKAEGWIGNENEAESPPGWLNRPDNAGPKKDK